MSNGNRFLNLRQKYIQKNYCSFISTQNDLNPSCLHLMWRPNFPLCEQQFFFANTSLHNENNTYAIPSQVARLGASQTGACDKERPTAAQPTLRHFNTWGFPGDFMVHPRFFDSTGGDPKTVKFDPASEWETDVIGCLVRSFIIFASIFFFSTIRHKGQALLLSYLRGCQINVKKTLSSGDNTATYGSLRLLWAAAFLLLRTVTVCIFLSFFPASPFAYYVIFFNGKRIKFIIRICVIAREFALIKINYPYVGSEGLL